MKKMLKRGLAGAAVAGSSVVASSANAAIDLTPVTSAFTAADVTVGVLAVAGVLATIYATIKAAKIALGMLRGG